MAGQIKDKEAYQRLNYLYQAAHCVLSQNAENVELARFYCFTQKTIARRLVLRHYEEDKVLEETAEDESLCDSFSEMLLHHLKRSISEENIVQELLLIAYPWCNCYNKTTKCLSCGQSKTLLNNPDHCLWVDRPEAQMGQQKQPDQGPSQKNQSKDIKNKEHDGAASSEQSAVQSTEGMHF